MAPKGKQAGTKRPAEDDAAGNQNKRHNESTSAPTTTTPPPQVVASPPQATMTTTTPAKSSSLAMATGTPTSNRKGEYTLTLRAKETKPYKESGISMVNIVAAPTDGQNFQILRLPQVKDRIVIKHGYKGGVLVSQAKRDAGLKADEELGKAPRLINVYTLVLSLFVPWPCFS